MATTKTDSLTAAMSAPVEIMTPIAASTQMDAAEVTPRTTPSLDSITPAPKKPIPVITCPTTLDGSMVPPLSIKAVDKNK